MYNKLDRQNCVVFASACVPSAQPDSSHFGSDAMISVDTRVCEATASLPLGYSAVLSINHLLGIVEHDASLSILEVW